LRRHSLRLKGYDYTLPGAYFVTVCTWQRACTFGDVVEGEMRLNIFGEIANQGWIRLGKRFPWADFSSFVVMPNHVHGIIVIHGETRRGAGFDSESRPEIHRLRLEESNRRGAGFDSESVSEIQPLRPGDEQDHGDWRTGAGVDEGVRPGRFTLRTACGGGVAGRDRQGI
jgi:hypothetical protein